MNANFKVIDAVNENQHAVANTQQVSSGLQIRLYTPEAISAILDLTQETLGNSGAVRKTEAFWHWKHETNPFGQSYGLFSWDELNSRLAGLRVLMRWRFNTPVGYQLQAVRAVDTATHPAYQRRGIFSTLTRQAVAELSEAGVHFIFNTPNQQSLPGYLKMGWQVVATWPIYIKLLRPVRMLAGLIRRSPAGPHLPAFEQYFGREVMNWETFTHQYAAKIPALLEAWEQERTQVGLRTPRELTYLQWRYGQHPHLQYGVYALEQAGDLSGFAILRPNFRYGFKEVVLTELFLKSPDLEFGRLFLNSLHWQLKADYIVAHFAQNTVERAWLGRNGFLRVPRRGMVFTVRPLNVLPQDVLQPATWDLSLGDLELF